MLKKKETIAAGLVPLQMAAAVAAGCGVVSSRGWRRPHGFVRPGRCGAAARQQRQTAFAASVGDALSFSTSLVTLVNVVSGNCQFRYAHFSCKIGESHQVDLAMLFKFIYKFGLDWFYVR
jgi:hypothetical protein